MGRTRSSCEGGLWGLVLKAHPAAFAAPAWRAANAVFADQGVRVVFADIQRAQITADMILL